MNPFLLFAATVSLPPRALESADLPLVLYVDPPDNLEDLLVKIRSDALGAGGYPRQNHFHQGRLLNQYARQPRAEAERICRGRP